MNAKRSMDLFGEAITAYAQGDKGKFHFKDGSGKIFEHDLKRYFRKTSQMSKSECRLISLSYGDILDVGCGTGNYIPLLAKRGKVLGIDISKKIIGMAKMNGCNNCMVADIFTFSASKKFDTIVLLENNLGIGGSVSKTRKLLVKLSNLLKDDGQILAITGRQADKKYAAVELMPVWKKRIGQKFNWIHFNLAFLAELCRQEGLRLKVLWGNKHCHLLKIVKI